MIFVIIIFIISAIVWFSSKVISVLANLTKKLAKVVCMFSGIWILVWMVSRAVV